MESDQIGRVLYLVLLLAAVGGWVLVEYRARMGQALRVAMAWALIFLGVMAGYGIWQDLRHDVIPRQRAGAAEVEIPRAPDGHYYVEVSVGGQVVRFLADTGATGVVLTQSDAARLGIDVPSLVFGGASSTANGVVRTARVRLQDMVFGPFADAEVGAWVNEGEMDTSLLGMDYLGRFRIEIAGDRMILRR